LTDARADAKRELVLSLLESGRPLDDEQRQFVRDAIAERDALLCLNLSIEVNKEDDDEDEDAYGDDMDEQVDPDDLEPDESPDAVEPYPDDIVQRTEVLAALRLESLKVDAKRAKK
jgi:hypothetical protein